uniref:VWFA domain-containing protein n=1 Tax=Sphaeramia orbicularis TaxID=375764 RepID=A0A673B293_9TELE
MQKISSDPTYLNMSHVLCSLAERQPTGRDVVFLLDGSDGTRTEFPEFIRRVVESLSVGEDKIRIGVVQYSDRPQADIDLNSHTTKEGVLSAVRRLRHRGGRQRNLGQALEFLRQDFLTTARGSRRQDGVPQFVIAVSSGPSTDDITRAATSLKQSRVLPFSIGTRDVNPTELRVVSYVPNYAYTVDDLPGLYTVQENLITTLTELSDDEIAGMRPVFPDYEGNLLLLYKKIVCTVKTPSPTGGEKRDVVFLIDGTTAVRSEFPAIREMIKRVVDKLDVGLDQVRISVVQYSDEPKVEFLLNEFSTKDEVRQAVARLRSRGGDRLNTGRALEYVSRNIYQRSAGSPEASQHLVVLTGGRSPQDVSIYGPLLKGSRVNCIGIGSSGADPRQLAQITTTSDDVFQVATFPSLPAIKDRVISRLSGTIEEIPTEASGLPPPKKADIVFLVDGSINLGRENFKEVMEFIINLIDLFFTDRDDLRFGLAHYAVDVSDVFYLNTYNNREDIVSAIGRAEYKGGRRINTGAAIRHVQDNHFIKEKGSRKDEGTPQILMLITGGRSADDSKTAALGLKNTGVRIFAVGVGNIENELENIASESTTVARASTYQMLSELNEQILETLDDEVKGKLCVGVPEVTRGKKHFFLAIVQELSCFT